MKQNDPISVTDDGMLICCKLMQFSNAELPKLCTDDGMNISFNDEQSLNAYQSIFVTDELYKKLDKYLPNNKDFKIISTFIHICNLIVEEQNVLDSFKSMPNAFWNYNKYVFFSVQT